MVSRSRLVWRCIGCWVALTGLTGVVSAQGLWRGVDKAGVVHIGNVAPAGLHEVTWLSGSNGGRPSASGGLAHAGAASGREVVKGQLKQAAAFHDVEPELVLAVAAVESAYDAKAVSRRGAMGVMQIMPATAERYGYMTIGSGERSDAIFDVPTNASIGSRYLADLLRLFDGDKELALAAYNAGEGAVMRYGRRVPPYAETQQYVVRVLKQYNAFVRARG